jgi:thiol:disulfide interchange protein DsbD
MRTMRTNDRRAAFLPRHRFAALLSILLALVCLWPTGMSTAASSQSPPKIPGLPGFGRPKADVPPAFGDSRDQVDVQVLLGQPSVAPGGDLPLALEFKLLKHYHIWTKPGPAGEGFAEFDGAIRTEITLNPGENGASMPIAGVFLNDRFLQWPEPHAVEADLGEGRQKYEVYEGDFAVFVPISIAKDAKPGMVEFPLVVSFQACDDTGCSAPAEIELTVRFEISASPPAAAPNAAFSAFDPSVYGRIRSGDAPTELLEFTLFSATFSIDPNGAGFLLLLLIAAAGGALLNFTPCVLPVIPLKIIGLAQAAQGSRAKCFALGFVMSLGVVAFWMGLGVMIATVKGFTSTNQLFQTPAFTIAVGCIIGVMAVGMAGLFTMKLPDWVYMVEAKHDSYWGSFLFGVMTAVLSTPCTAPLMGTAVAWATTQGPGTILTVFAAVGSGMAFPYLILSANPKLIDRMPRTGPASDLIKQVMGLLLLAAAAYFIGAGVAGILVEPPEPPSHLYWWFVASLGGAAGGWLLLRTFALTTKSVNRFIFGGLGAFILTVSVLIGLSQTAKGPVDWTYYTPERLAAAQQAGKVVVVDFTAEWCANCKTLEALVLNTPAVSKELNADDVESIKVDLTGNNAAGNALLKASNRVTIPLLLVYARDGSLVMNSTEYTPAQVLAAIAEARGKSKENGASGG